MNYEFLESQGLEYFGNHCVNWNPAVLINGINL